MAGRRWMPSASRPASSWNCSAGHCRKCSDCPWDSTAMMATSRRRFLAASATLCAAWGLPWPTTLQAADRRYFVSACSDAAHNTLARVVAEDGRTVKREVVAFARRPGRFALVFDPLSGEPARQIAAAEGRHFYGHGAFSRDGRWLFACENDYENARGCIGVYDATAGYRREAELD